MSTSLVLVVLDIASTWLMVGVIWTIQLVHYPSFAMVDRTTFAAFHRFHGQRITWIVLPAMTLELATAMALAWRNGSLVAWVGLGCAGLAWVATASLSVPAHNRLSAGFDAVAHRRLVVTNWIRTAAFTAHGVSAAMLLRIVD